jgi:hypothetical protein
VAGRRDTGAGGRRGSSLSDIGILNDPVSLAVLALVFGSPGLVIGAVVGALLWRTRRFTGAVLGAMLGFVAWLAGWMWLRDMI